MQINFPMMEWLDIALLFITVNSNIWAYLGISTRKHHLSRSCGWNVRHLASKISQCNVYYIDNGIFRILIGICVCARLLLPLGRTYVYVYY